MLVNNVNARMRSDLMGLSKIMRFSGDMSYLMKATVPAWLVLVLFSVSAWSIHWPRPWALVVLHGDLYAAFGAEETFIELVSFSVNFLLLFALFVISKVFGRAWAHLRSGPVMAPVAAGLLLCLVIVCYPKAKALFLSQLLVDDPSNTIVVLVDRNVYYPEETRVRGLVIACKENPARYLPMDVWPFSLLPEQAVILVITDQRMSHVLDILRGTEFFAAPEQLDPRPSLNFEGLYIAIYQPNRMFRSFGRASEAGFERLNSARARLLEVLELDNNWFEVPPAIIQR